MEKFSLTCSYADSKCANLGDNEWIRAPVYVRKDQANSFVSSGSGSGCIVAKSSRI